MRFPVALCSLLVVAACQQPEEASRCSVGECGPSEFRSTFFPMAVGNTWVFSDTTFTASDTTVRTYTLSITGYNADSLGVWWSFDGFLYPPYGALMQRNDSIFKRLTTASGAALPVLRYIAPPGPDSAFFTAPIDDDVPTRQSVVPLAEPYVTAAGSFVGCASYHRSYVEEYHAVLCPGIGPVGYDIYSDGMPGAYPAGHRKLRLMSYTLKK